MIADDDDISRRDQNRRHVELKVERFREQSKNYFRQLSVVKNRLSNHDNGKNFAAYVHELNEFGKIVQSLEQNLRYIEELHADLNDEDRAKINPEVNTLRFDVEREIVEFQKLRRKAMDFSSQQSDASDEAVMNKDESGRTVSEETSGLRQRLLNADQLNDSYQAVEKDLINLKETITLVSQLVANQRTTIWHTDQLITSAQSQLTSATTYLQSAVRHKYGAMASGALIGASLAGPIGLFMGMKAAAIATIGGSAIGAVSATIVHKKTSQDISNTNQGQVYDRAML